MDSWLPERRRAAKAPGFGALLAPFDILVLNDEPNTIYGVGPDLRLGYMNRAWFELAGASGCAWNAEAWGLGASILDATPVILRAFYEALFARAASTGAVVTHDYECSTPTTFRRFRMRVHPCASSAFLVTSAAIVESTHARGGAPGDEDLYRDEDGQILQCSHCRCVRTVEPPRAWVWVPELVARRPAGVSHGLCAVCFDYHYPADVAAPSAPPR